MNNSIKKKRLLCVIICIISILNLSMIIAYSQTAENSEKTNVESLTQSETKTEETKPETDKKEKNESKAEGDIILRPVIIKGEAGDDKKGNQKVSSHTMTVDELKQVPASMGDSVSALTSLPGIIRGGTPGGDNNGLWGPLVVRGASAISNSYLIDDIPIFSPLHYGGMHSVINNNLINQIDLYASAFPAEYGSATAAIMDITTVDEVNEFSGFVDASLLSANVLVQSPILRNESGDLNFFPSSDINERGKTENAGYSIVSGRYGYWGLIIPFFINKDEEEVTPEYWDYQAKFKYCFNSSHSIAILLMGSKDFFRYKKKKTIKKEEDPYIEKLEFKMDQMHNSQGMYYTYEPSKKISNKLIAFSSLNKNYFHFDVPSIGVASWARDVHVTSRPDILGFKDRFKYEWWEDIAIAKAGIEYKKYIFTADGRNIIPNGRFDVFDLGDEDLMTAYTVDEKVVNHLISGNAENKFIIGDMIVVPGIRSDYLERSDVATCDPRIMASYEFPTETTVSVATGKYSSFLQTNPVIFDSYIDLAKLGNELKPEKAIHRVVGVEQKIDLFILKAEGFYNNFYDTPQAYPHTEPDGSYLSLLSSGKVKAKGFEIMISKDTAKGQGGLFGWMSYTYTRSIYKSGLPTTSGLYGIASNPVGDVFGDKWITYEYERKHTLKITSGYVKGDHTISIRFQLYSSFPYTPIVSSHLDTDYFNDTGKSRYIPETGARNSRHFPMDHKLDVRYSWKHDVSWGYISYFCEIMNIYNYRPIIEHKWDYRYPYGSDNPENVSPDPEEDPMLGIFPNFGVEIKF